MKIEKLQYSSRPWRLMKNGQEFWVPAVFDHPVSGKILIDEPLVGDTKKELIDNILQAFDPVNRSCKC